MENLNLVEILKDCPKGTKLYSPALGECVLEGVIDNSDYPIKVKYKIINNDTRVDCFTKDGYILLNKPDAECMLFPSKYQRDWSKWQRPFVDGDIVTYKNQMAIFKKYINIDDGLAECYVFFDSNLEMDIDGNYYVKDLATEEEKQKLFKALEDNGYKWNAETKTLEKLIVPKFKVGDKVVKKGDINLLLKDICGRLPYGVKAHVKNWSGLIMEWIENDYVVMSAFPSLNEVHVQSESGSLNVILGYYDYEFKPYLFPLSSMTVEQRKEFIQCAGYEAREEENGYHYETYYYDLVGHGDNMFPDADGLDWLNANHFDYRGLIDKDLALDATGLNIY